MEDHIIVLHNGDDEAPPSVQPPDPDAINPGTLPKTNSMDSDADKSLMISDKDESLCGYACSGMSLLALPFTMGLSYFVGQRAVRGFAEWGTVAFHTSETTADGIAVATGIFAAIIGGVLAWKLMAFFGETLGKCIDKKSKRFRFSADMAPPNVKTQPSLLQEDQIDTVMDNIAKHFPGMSIQVTDQLKYFVRTLSSPGDINRGLVLSGLPGTGKSALAVAIASALQGARPNLELKLVKGPELLSKYHGESEENVRKLFTCASPTTYRLIVLDEIDALAPRRDNTSCGGRIDAKLVGQMLTMLSGLESNPNILVIGTTNLLRDLDEALLREGRLGIHIVVPFPDKIGRIAMLMAHLKQYSRRTDLDVEAVAALTEGYTPARLAGVIQRAFLFARSRKSPIVQNDLLTALH